MRGEFSERTLIYLLIVAFLGGMAAYMISVVRNAEPAPTALSRLYEGIPRDEKLLHLDKDALNAAYSQQLLKLWNVWLTEGGKDPTHFSNGLRNARRAYGLAEDQITKREQELKGGQP